MKRKLLSFFFVLASPIVLLAWGSEGHKIIANISKSVLKKNTIDSVQFYLEGTSFEEAAVWMDEVRANHKFDYLKAKHYINVEKDQTYVKVDGPNIINELESVMSQLSHRKNFSRTEIKMALLILFHLIGDLHQPLHVGYEKDKGGNEIHLKFKNKKTNLHRLWDTDIIENEKISLQNCENKLHGFSKNETKKIQSINILNWMNESRTHLKDVYDFKNNQIDDAYVLKNKSLVQIQLVKAGLRLAAVLEDCFGK